MKKADNLSAGGLAGAAMIVLKEFGLPKKIVSDAGTNFVLDQFQQFCRQLNIEHVITSSFHHQSNSQVEACIKFEKHFIRNCFYINNDINITLLLIRSMPLGA